MRPPSKRIVALLVLAGGLAQAAGNSWNKIRYAGGTVPAKVNPFDWNTTLTVASDRIILMFAHRTTLRLAPSQITALSYGEEAHRHVADMVALSVHLPGGERDCCVQPALGAKLPFH